MNPFAKSFQTISLSCMVSSFGSAEVPEYQLLNKLIGTDYTHSIAILRPQIGFANFPALLVTIKPQNDSKYLLKYDKFTIKYEYIELNYLESKIKKYLQKGVVPNFTKMECPQYIAELLTNVKIDLSSKDHFTLQDDGAGYYCLFRLGLTELFITTAHGSNRQLDYLVTAIEHEIEIKANTKWRTPLPPSP